MKMRMKIVVFALVVSVVWAVNLFWVDAVQPVVSADLAVANVNGKNAEWQAVNVFQKNKGLVGVISFISMLALGLFMFVPRGKEEKPVEAGVASKVALFALLGFIIIATSGCRKPYDVPEYGDISTSETGFLVKLEGDTANQAKFNSVQFLEEKKVSTKRVQIVHRWNQTGYWGTEGKWIPIVRLIKVDRSPVTRQWEAKVGPDGKVVPGGDAIWIESADSVGFSMGWSISGYVKEEDAATFLYMYPSGSLAVVMDGEIRARVLEVAANVAAGFKLDILRDKKIQLATEVKKNITEFFATRGITITTVGMYGGMTYENPEIQKSIDQTFISQQEKVNAAAFLDAQRDKNARIQSEAIAVAEASRSKAQGTADGNYMIAQAEAKGIEAINEAIAKANNNPMLIQLKGFEVEKARIEKWNGDYRGMTIVGSGANTWVGIGNNTPTNVAVPAVAK